MPKKFFHDKKEKDLFEDLQTADKNIRKKVRLQLPRLKNRLSLSYENLIFLAIGFVMCSIIFFSFGVEKGRQDVNGIKVLKYKSIKERAGNAIVNGSAQQETIKKSSSKSGYIIQLAVFKDSNSAEKEHNSLVKKGYKAGIKKSGDYYQLYVGDFAEKKEAKKLLKGLQVKYKDCYIKENR